ncbi:MAG TPA: isoleucine--tRNA ligase [Pirellulales bacterium]|jgi:isoleucyl-tRNA synthetase|nr:isoleucine--tRNA ligase [Pirellulales bacterium]
MFQPVPSSVHFPTLEAEIGEFWRHERIYEQSLERPAPNGQFIFYEGPPTANGMPHPGHCLTRAIKDLFPRYRTMRGYHCERKAGWDTHGLPVEVEVCKELGIHSKEEIEAYGVEPFIHKCQQSVWRYMREWEKLTERIGFWIRLDEAYVTYHQSYVESVWWALKNLFDRGLLYQGHKIVWWWAQGGTALSAGEVGQGYREVADPSVYVRFPLVDRPDTSLLVWTTTPWTLPSNQFAAVHPTLDYALVADEQSGQKLIVAIALLDALRSKSGLELPVQETLKGAELVGLRYQPPFDYYYKTLGERQGRLKVGGQQHVAWRVVPAEFVTVDSGTGVVHQAPAFGEVDFDVLQAEMGSFEPGEGPELICAVGPDGRFTDEAPDYTGRWVKEADKDITRELRRRGLLFHLEQYLHEYPFCWRAEQDPLIQYPRQSWFIRTTQFKEPMLENNSRIHWLPEHIRDGRFGNFLESNVDWALSRERYWGTPLPIWVCEATGHMEAIASYDELLAKPGVSGTEAWEAAKAAHVDISEHLKVHKPYIDAITYESPKAPGKRMRRVSDVIDCWFDSGAMPFAQWGWPHTGREQFANHFPADFISEALDQTRGWFYSQLAISTLLFSPCDNPLPPAAPRPEYPHPFRNCIVLGLMLGEDGQKMSKQKRNYREPGEIFDKYGADALRWYFFANQPPWTSIRYSEQAIKDSIPEFLLRLWNVYSFFVIYANIDGFDPGSSLTGDCGSLDAAVLSQAAEYRPVGERSELDRWILGELNRTTAAVARRMDEYDNFAACAQITALVDALSNWYLRRSRDRFWAGEWTTDKLDAYWTLYECLLTTARLIAPFVPFLAETLWQNLAVAGTGGRAAASVHLAEFPGGDVDAVDDALSEQMALVREIVSLGRNARTVAKIKVRQPLEKVELILVNPRHGEWIEAHAALIREELNVKQVELAARADQYITYTVLPDLKRLGPRLGKRLPQLRQALAAADAAALLAQLETQGHVVLPVGDEPVTLDAQDIQVRLQAKPGWAAAQGPSAVVVLSTDLTPVLIVEGVARELVHAIQNHRKESGCEYTDRISVGIDSDDEAIQHAMRDFADYIRGETLAIRLANQAIVGVEPIGLNLGGVAAQLYVKVERQE